MAAKPKTHLAPCNRCCSKTNHKTIKEQKLVEEADGHTWTTIHRMIECQGCDCISLEKIVHTSAYEGVEHEYFPPPISRRKPEWVDYFLSPVPTKVCEIISEVYTALHAKSLTLSAMGARAVLDIAMTDKVEDVGRFDEKLDKLEQEGFIAPIQRKVLEAALDAGNAATHRGHKPTIGEMNQVMDIVEGVIHQLYIQPDLAEELVKKTPKRKAPKPKS